MHSPASRLTPSRQGALRLLLDSAGQVLAHLDVSLLELELSSDLLGPPSLELILRRVSHSKDGLQVLEGKVLVLIRVAVLASCAKRHEVGHELSDLVRVHMVGQGEWSRANLNLLGNGRIKPFLRKNLLKDGVKSLAVTAKVVFEELNLDVSLVLALGPSGVGSEDRLGIS